MITFWFGLVFTVFFWGYLFSHILKMKQSGIKSLTISTKSRIKNLLSLIFFLGILIAWCLIFILNALTPIDSLIFLYMWSPEAIFILTIMGYFMASLFLVIIIVAIKTMGLSWRIGVDDKNPGELVIHGIFSISRNPIFLGLDGIVIAGFIIQPNLFFLSFAILAILLIHVQIINEEGNLRGLYGQSYKDYSSKTRRYL